MARVPLIGYEDATPEVKDTYDEHVLSRYLATGAYGTVESPRVIQPWRAWANCPALTKTVAVLANYSAVKNAWVTRHPSLKTLMTVAIYRRYRTAEYGLWAHQTNALKVYSREQIELLDDLAEAKMSPLFNEEEKTILAFCEGVLDTGDCRLEIWEDVVARYGFPMAIEMTAAFANWFMWVPIFAVFRTERDNAEMSMEHISTTDVVSHSKP